MEYRNCKRTSIQDTITSHSPLIIIAYLISTGLIELNNSIKSFLDSFPIIAEINSLLGFGTSLIIVFLLSIPIKFQKNDYIAGPIESLLVMIFICFGFLEWGNSYSDVLYLLAYLALALSFYLFYFEIPVFGLIISGSVDIFEYGANEFRLHVDRGFGRSKVFIFIFVLYPIIEILSLTLSVYLLKDIISPYDAFSDGNLARLQYISILILVFLLISKILKSIINKTKSLFKKYHRVVRCEFEFDKKW